MLTRLVRPNWPYAESIPSLEENRFERLLGSGGQSFESCAPLNWCLLANRRKPTGGHRPLPFAIPDLREVSTRQAMWPRSPRFAPRRKARIHPATARREESGIQLAVFR